MRYRNVNLWLDNYPLASDSLHGRFYTLKYYFTFSFRALAVKGFAASCTCDKFRWRLLFRGLSSQKRTVKSSSRIMADQSIKCRFLLKDPLDSTEPQAIGLDTVQAFQHQLREQWYEAIIEHNISSSTGRRHNLQNFILDPNGGIEVKEDPTDSDTDTLSTDYVTLSAALAALDGNEQIARLNPAKAIEVLHQTRLLGEPIPLTSMLAFSSFVLAAKLHQSSKSFLPNSVPTEH